MRLAAEISKFICVVNDGHHATLFSVLQKCNRKHVCTIIWRQVWAHTAYWPRTMWLC